MTKKRHQNVYECQPFKGGEQNEWWWFQGCYKHISQNTCFHLVSLISLQEGCGNLPVAAFLCGLCMFSYHSKTFTLDEKKTLEVRCDLCLSIYVFVGSDIDCQHVFP